MFVYELVLEHLANDHQWYATALWHNDDSKQGANPTQLADSTRQVDLRTMLRNGCFESTDSIDNESVASQSGHDSETEQQQAQPASVKQKRDSLKSPLPSPPRSLAHLERQASGAEDTLAPMLGSCTRHLQSQSGRLTSSVSAQSIQLSAVNTHRYKRNSNSNSNIDYVMPLTPYRLQLRAMRTSRRRQSWATSADFSQTMPEQMDGLKLLFPKAAKRTGDKSLSHSQSDSIRHKTAKPLYNTRRGADAQPAASAIPIRLSAIDRAFIVDSQSVPIVKCVSWTQPTKASDFCHCWSVRSVGVALPRLDQPVAKIFAAQRASRCAECIFETRLRSSNCIKLSCFLMEVFRQSGKYVDAKFCQQSPSY